MLDRGEVEPEAEDFEEPPYWWQAEGAEEADDPNAASSIWYASTTNFSTSLSRTIHFVASFAPSEADFRWIIAREWGSKFAHHAKVNRRADGGVPFQELFVSPNLEADFATFEGEESRPGAMLFSARYHTNYS